jgi:D-3-phosphoglycerate dehydrogenase
VISLYAVGTDGVDVEEATRRGIVVTNVPGYCTPDVAEHAIALLLAAWRRLPRAERVARSGDWGLEELRPVRRLAGCTVGLLGFGRIAREVATRLAAFGVTLLAYDPYAEAEAAAALGVRLCGLEELLALSAAVSVHVPLTDETRGLLDGEALALLPEGAVIVNAGRGGVIDEAALEDALRSGRVAAAALDVVAVEPPPPDHPLLRLENVICTPHMAYYSEDSLRDLRESAARNAALALTGRRPESLVNPSVLTD